MIEKVIHKKALEKIYKEQLECLNSWKKALRLNERILNKKYNKSKYKPSETEAIYDFIIAIGIMGLPKHIKSLEAKLKVIKRMINKKTKSKKLKLKNKINGDNRKKQQKKKQKK